jgi:hypothetical protein
MGSHPVREARVPGFAFIGRNARPSTDRSVLNILAQLSAAKQWVMGGGGRVLNSPLSTNID